MTTTLPALYGVRVLELTQAAPGQAAGMLLADLGAAVVRIIGEGPEKWEAEVERVGLPAWLCWNRGKSIIATTEPIDGLIERADVLLYDGRPSELVEAGLDPASLRSRNPALVSVWMPPTAARGRWSELSHDHLLLDALGGFAAHHPATTEVPVASVVPTRFLVQGALAGVAALSGLYARSRDGWGRAATVSGLHAEAATLNSLVNRSVDGPAVVAPGKLLPGGPNFRLYQAADGQWLYLASLSPKLFIKALEVLDRLDIFAHPDIAGEFINVLRPEVGRSVGAELDKTFAQASAAQWLERFTAAGVPAALVGKPEDWLRGPVIANACPPVVRRHQDLGDVVMPGTPVLLARNPPVPGACAIPVSGPLTEIWADVNPHPQSRPRPSGDGPGADDRPLGGLRVLDASTFLAGPFISTLLAVHGADVIKIEAPSGDPYSVFNAPYGNVNEHKPRLRLNLRDGGDRAKFLELVGVADVVVDNLIASSLARLQLNPERFEGANPRVVRCSLTAYGADGPYAELPGFDPIMQTLSGLVAIQGGDGRPIHTAAPVHDIATGCLGAMGVLAALLVRHRDGHGQRTFVSLAATSTFLQSGEFTTYSGRPARAVGGPDFPGPSAWQRYYRAADRWLAVSASTPQHRAAMMAVLGAGHNAADGDDDAAAFAARIAERDCDGWVNELQRAGVPVCAAINRVELDDPFLVENRYSHLIETPAGRVEVVNGYTDWQHVDRRPPLSLDQLTADRVNVLARWGHPGQQD